MTPVTPRCYTHPDRRAIAVCSSCGAFLCPDCVSKSTSVGNELVCPACRTRSPRRETVAPPWEDRRGAGPVRAFFATWRAVVFNSRGFFHALPPDGPVFKPVLYAVICIAIGLVGAVPAAMQSFTALSSMFDPSMLAAGIVFALVLIPPLYAVGFAVTVVFLHLLARGLGGTGNLSATLRAVSYAQSASIAEVIPIIGGLLALLLRLFFYGRGVPAVHDLSPFRSFSFYLILTITIFGLIYLLFRLATSFLPASLIS
jgi:hypothetical protein